MATTTYEPFGEINADGGVEYRHDLSLEAEAVSETVLEAEQRANRMAEMTHRQAMREFFDQNCAELGFGD